MRTGFTICVFFLLALSARSQSLVWAKNLGGILDDECRSMVVDIHGNVYTTGYFSGLADFNPDPLDTFNLSAVGGSDVFISKLDSSGGFQWARRFGGNSVEIGNSIDVDEFGNVYTSGFFAGTVDFDPAPNDTFNLTATGGTDVFISKLNALGEFVWTKNIGGISDEFGIAIELDHLGNSLVTGHFEGVVDFNPDPFDSFFLTSSGNVDIFVVKLDKDGGFVWAKGFGGEDYDFSWSLAVDRQGNVYTVGDFSGTADFNPDLIDTFNLTATDTDVFVSKLDYNGNLIWAKQFQGTASSIAYAVAVDSMENVYTTGFFLDTTDFNPAYSDTFILVSDGFYDAYICKLDDSGGFVWAKQFTGDSWVRGSGIVVDPSGNVYTTGHFHETIDFDPDSSDVFKLTSNGSSDVFVSKLDNTGKLQWVRHVGGSSPDAGVSVALHPFSSSGNVYTAGNFHGTVDFDEGVLPSDTFFLRSAGMSDFFIYKMRQCSVDTSVINYAPTLVANASGASYQWLFCDSILVAGATSKSFTATVNGSYAVVITQDGCSDTSACYDVTNVGWDREPSQGIAIYPNPTQGRVFVSWSKSQQEMLNVVIRNVMGQIVSTQQHSFSDNLALNIDGIPGIYYVELRPQKEPPLYFKVLKQ